MQISRLKKNTWLEMINLIDLFEIECFKNFSKKLNRESINEIKIRHYFNVFYLLLNLESQAI